jgi:transposase
MSKEPLVPDELWEAIEPLIPPSGLRPQGGRPRVPDRAALGGILFVLRTGTPWRLLPQELGCGSGPTCWRRLRDWQEAGVWERLHERVLNWLGDAGVIDWERANLDSLSVRAKKGAPRQAPARSTAASVARRITSPSSGRGSRSRSRSRLPTSTTRSSSSR